MRDDFANLSYIYGIFKPELLLFILSPGGEDMLSKLSRRTKIWMIVTVLLLVYLGACNMPANILLFTTATLTPTMTYTPSLTPSITASYTPTNTATSIPTSSFTPTQTNTPTPSITLSPTNTQPPTNTPLPTDTPTSSATATVPYTPTPDAVTVKAEQNVNCRWGPGGVFLIAGLFREGAVAQVDGRDYGSHWLKIQMEGFSYRCWVATSAVVVQGDLETVLKVPGDPPINSEVPSATGVSATRNGNQVTIVWNPAPSAVDLHYLVRANVCNGQYVLEVIDTTTRNVYVVEDKDGCSGNSSARVYVVNKKGYAAPVTVSW